MTNHSRGLLRLSSDRWLYFFDWRVIKSKDLQHHFDNTHWCNFYSLWKWSINMSTIICGDFICQYAILNINIPTMWLNTNKRHSPDLIPRINFYQEVFVLGSKFLICLLFWKPQTLCYITTYKLNLMALKSPHNNKSYKIYHNFSVLSYGECLCKKF